MGMKPHLIIDTMYAVHLRLVELENQPREIEGGATLHARELHALAAISGNPSCNMTELARVLGISVPAVFKTTSRLLDKGYLEKGKTLLNAKDVIFNLTSLGKKAVEIHGRLEHELFHPLFALEESLSPEDRMVIGRFVESLKEALP